MSTPTDLAPMWDSSALLLIDVQHDFVDPGGAMPVPGTSDVLDALGELVDAFRSAGRPIVHVVRLYTPYGADVDLPRRAAISSGARIVAPGSLGSQVPPALLPGDISLDSERLLSGKPQIVGADEIIIFKPRWSAFFRTELDTWLRERGVSTAVVAGCNLPNCPRATLFDASNRDYRTVLVADATSQCTPERVADLALIGTSIHTVEEVTHALTAT